MYRRLLHVACLIALIRYSAHAQQPAWVLASDHNFEIYTDAGEQAGRSTLAWFEQLRSWFIERTRLTLGDRPPVRILAFRTAEEYSRYRLDAASDAHYIGTESQDFIAMPLTAVAASTAAHEYTHLMLHASGFAFPRWLSEGLAEFFSTIQISGQSSTVGGPIPSRGQILDRRSWIPFGALLTQAPLQSDRRTSEMFYAESWALTNMLVLSPDYAPRFDDLIEYMTKGDRDATALEHVYGKSPPGLQQDVHGWLRRIASVSLPPLSPSSISEIETATISRVSLNTLVAEMLLTTGEIGRAKSIYTALYQTAPDNPEVLGGLGLIALIDNENDSAQRLWTAAVAHGIRDSFLCYRFGNLAQGSLPDEAVRPALERALELRPDFDDARYILALNLSNAREFQKALDQFLAMRYIAPARRFAYWAAVSYAYEELDRRPEAITAANKALTAANSAEEQIRARQLAYTARTDLTVQVVADKDGQTRLATARKPHNDAAWNPFIEPSDQIKIAEGVLTRVDCLQGKAVHLGVATASGNLVLTIADPAHIQVVNGPAEFACGVQTNPAKTRVVYASLAAPGSQGIVRGIEFH